MALVLDATAGGANANSYATVVEAQNYYDARVPGVVADAWDDADSQEALLVMATRTLESILSPLRRLIRVSSGSDYYLIAPTWIGTVATATQALMVPRIGLYTRTGVLIAPTVVPTELKEATAELAGQLAVGDRTLDNDVAVQGITSVKAGSVAVTFKNDIAISKMLPDFVLSLLVPSWLTDELTEPALPALFDVVNPW